MNKLKPLADGKTEVPMKDILSNTTLDVISKVSEILQPPLYSIFHIFDKYIIVLHAINICFFIIIIITTIIAMSLFSVLYFTSRVAPILE